LLLQGCLLLFCSEEGTAIAKRVAAPVAVLATTVPATTAAAMVNFSAQVRLVRMREKIQQVRYSRHLDSEQ